MRSIAIFALVLASGLITRPLEARAQQTGPATGVRGGYYSRVQTSSGSDSMSGRGSASRLRLDQSRGVDGPGRPVSNVEAYRGGLDPLRVYGTDARRGVATRPYEPKPAVSPPERPAPAPSTPHNYFPSLRPGQGSNRNMAHCVPGRAALLHR